MEAVEHIVPENQIPVWPKRVRVPGAANPRSSAAIKGLRRG